MTHPDPKAPAPITDPRDRAPGRVVLDAAGIERATTRIAHEILERDPDADDLVLVAIVRGGEPVAKLVGAKLAELCGHPVPTGALDITLYRDDLRTISPHPIVHSTELPFDVEGRVLVLVDDVLYTGRTVRAALGAIMDYGRPRAIQLAVLVDRGHRELPIRADYVGKNVPTAQRENVTVFLREEDGEDSIQIDEMEPEEP